MEDQTEFETDKIEEAIKISRQFIILLEDYRYLLACYQESCGCHVNFDYQYFYRKIEEKHKMLSSVSSLNTFLKDALDDNNELDNLNKLVEDVRNSKRLREENDDEKKLVARKKVDLTSQSARRTKNYEVSDDIETKENWSNSRQSKVNIDSLRGEKVAYKCTYSGCEFLSFNQNDICNHMTLHVEDPTFTIGKSKTISSVTISSTVTPATQSCNKEVLYICEHCGKEFNSRRLLHNHTSNSHEQVKVFLCDYPSCSFTTNYRCVIEDHRRRHSKTRDFKCDLCEAEFVTRRDLTAHVKYSHNGVKNYNCTWADCKASFKDSNRLRHHMFIHTGERPYRCDYPNCQASFKQLPHLNKHRITHNLKNVSVRSENAINSSVVN